MVAWSSLLAIGISGAIVSAAPVADGAPEAESVAVAGFNPEIVDGSFVVTRELNTQFTPHGPTAMYKALLKYGGTPSDDLIKTVMDFRHERASKRGVTGSVSNNPEAADSMYLTPVSIGTPAQVLQLDFDSGSSDLWVFSSSTPANQAAGHSVYTPNKSTTAKLQSGQSWGVTYGDGSSSKGTVYTDKVVIGGVTVTSQAVEAASQVSTAFVQETNLDGLLGLGFSNINSVRPTQQLTWWDNVKGSLLSPVWAVDFSHNKPGSFRFGSVDTKRYSGLIGWTNVNSAQGYWGFTATSYTVGNGGATGGAITGIADTGTTLALFPSAVVKAYYAKVTGATYNSAMGGYIFPCASVMPNFTFRVGGVDIVIPGAYISWAAVTGGANPSCYGGIQSSDGIGFAIFGDVALKSAYVVFETKKGATPRIGWAKKTFK